MLILQIRFDKVLGEEGEQEVVSGIYFQHITTYGFSLHQ